MFIEYFYFTNKILLNLVGTCWDKDFRMCLVLASLKVEQTHEKNSEFYLPEEQVCCGGVNNIIKVVFFFGALKKLKSY